MRNKHFAFRQMYDGIANELKSQVCIIVPSYIDSRPYEERSKIIIDGIWDTGATISAVAQNVIDKLGLKQTGAVPIGTAGGYITCPTYIIDLALPNRIVIPDLIVTGNDSLMSCDMLIGMDVIGNGDFAISNPKGKTCFSYCLPPHNKPIDLYEKTQKVDKNYKIHSALKK